MLLCSLRRVVTILVTDPSRRFGVDCEILNLTEPFVSGNYNKNTHTQCKPQYSKATPKLNGARVQKTSFSQYQPISPISATKNTHSDRYIYVSGLGVIWAK